MNFKLSVRADAQQEAQAIRVHYEQDKPGLGERFIDALEGCYADLRENPFYQVRKDPFRYAPIKGFKYYRVVFAVDGQEVTVYQVRHTSRKSSRKFGP